MNLREKALMALLIVVTSLSISPNINDAILDWQAHMRRVRLDAIELSTDLPRELVDPVRDALLPTKPPAIACGKDWVDEVDDWRADVAVRLRAEGGETAEATLIDNPAVDPELAACLLEATRGVQFPPGLTTPAFVVTWRFNVYQGVREWSSDDVVPEQFFGGY